MVARPRARAGAMLVATVVLGSSSPAAAEASRVRVVRERSVDAVVARAEVRLLAELRAAGFEVEERVTDSEADARRLVEEVDANAGGASSPAGADGGAGAGGAGGPVFATVLLQRAASGASTDVWVADHVTHKTVVRRMNAAGRGDAADRGLALRIVELMRASLVEALVMPPEPPPSAPAPVHAGPSSASSSSSSPSPSSSSSSPPPADVARWTREGAPGLLEPGGASAFRLGLGAAVPFAGPSLGAAVAPAVHLSVRPSRAWSIGLLAAGPAYGGRVTGVEGTADVRQELAILEVSYEGTLVGPVRGFVVAGAGAYHLDATGTASAAFTSGRADTWSALAWAGLGVRVALAGPTAVVLDAREVVAAPRPVVAFASDRVANAMSPGTLLGLSLEVDL